MTMTILSAAREAAAIEEELRQTWIHGADIPELDVREGLGDWFMDPQNSRIARYGENGVDWTDDPETCSQNTNAYVELVW